MVPRSPPHPGAAGIRFCSPLLLAGTADVAFAALGAVSIIPGLVIRALASGHVRKNEALATSGPYAYTRNPLYLGSLLLAIGFAVAARSWWVAASIGRNALRDLYARYPKRRSIPAREIPGVPGVCGRGPEDDSQDDSAIRNEASAGFSMDLT